MLQCHQNSLTDDRPGVQNVVSLVAPARLTAAALAFPPRYYRACSASAYDQVTGSLSITGAPAHSSIPADFLPLFTGHSHQTETASRRHSRAQSPSRYAAAECLGRSDHSRRTLDILPRRNG